MIERITMTIQEAMQALGLSYVTVYNLCKQNDFPSFRVGRRILIDREGLKKWMQERIEKK